MERVCMYCIIYNVNTRAYRASRSVDTYVLFSSHTLSSSSRSKTGNFVAKINVCVCVCVWNLKFNTWRGFPVDCTSRS
jgi:hypothetical protein